MNKIFTAMLFTFLVISPSTFAAENDMQMQQQMQKMESLMAQIATEQNPEKLEQMMSEHMKLMHEGMQMMGDSSAAATGMEMKARVDMMEMRMQKMQKMQMMMGQMMQHNSEEVKRPTHQHKR